MVGDSLDRAGITMICHSQNRGSILAFPKISFIISVLGILYLSSASLCMRFRGRVQFPTSRSQIGRWDFSRMKKKEHL